MPGLKWPVMCSGFDSASPMKRKGGVDMRKLLVIAGACFAMATVSWATPCTTLGSLTGTGCSVNGNVFSGLGGTLSTAITLTPITSGAGAGGFSLSLDLAALANTTNTFAFNIIAPTGFTITDLGLNLGAATAGSANVSLNLDNGSTLMATTGGTAQDVTFTGVTDLGVTGTLSVVSGATGTVGLTITPSLSPSSSATPEPGTFSLLGLGLLGLSLACGLKMREV
jgi:PEP-CTERM motif